MKWIKPSEIQGSLEAPPSKSMTIRSLAAASLCRFEAEIRNISRCDDGMAALNVVRGLGAEVHEPEGRVLIRGGVYPVSSELDCGESGLCMRMFAPIAALNGTVVTLIGRDSLKKRPMDSVEDALNPLGAVCRTRRGFPPILIQGPIRGGEVTLDGSLTSQVITGMLAALPVCRENSVVHLKDLTSRPYVEMTLSVLRHFSIEVFVEGDMGSLFIPGGQEYKGKVYEVEGDWSGAAFLLAAGAVGGSAEVRNLSTASLQADKKILDALRACGARVEEGERGISVSRRDLTAFDFDAVDCPDLFPPLSVLAACCKGKSRISGVHRLKHKESDRAAVLESELAKIGARLSINGDSMIIDGGVIPGGEIDSHGDHRIAMAGALAGIVSEKGIGIKGWRSVTKSYPKFFHDLEMLQEGKK